MDNNFYRLYRARLKNSLVAAYMRTPEGRKWGRESVEKEVLKFIFAFSDMAELVREKERMDAMREAAAMLALALDPCRCFVTHCTHNHYSYAMDCGEGKHPKRCPKLRAYVEKKACTPECGDCSLIDHNPFAAKWAFPFGKCTLHPKAIIPENCMKRRAKR